MLLAATFALVNGLSLILGAVLGTFVDLRQKVIAAFMAFGSGVLVCALTFGLMEEAFNLGGFDAIIIGFLCGGLVFIGSDYLIHTWGGRKHRRRPLKQSAVKTNGLMITLGSMLDGVPESIALGITLFTNQKVGLMMMAAVFISNFPESISSAVGLRKENFTKRHIFITWISAGLLIALTTILSYLFLHNLNPNTIGIIEALAAGAILAMLADSMMPEAYEEGGFLVCLLTIFGFLVAFVMSRL